MKRRQKEALAAAAGVCAGTCEAAQKLRQELATLQAEHARTLAMFKAEADQHFAVEDESEKKAQHCVRQLEEEVRRLKGVIDAERSLRKGLVP